jgi:hypothetical protein
MRWSDLHRETSIQGVSVAVAVVMFMKLLRILIVYNAPLLATGEKMPKVSNAQYSTR